MTDFRTRTWWYIPTHLARYAAPPLTFLTVPHCEHNVTQFTCSINYRQRINKELCITVHAYVINAQLIQSPQLTTLTNKILHSFRTVYNVYRKYMSLPSKDLKKFVIRRATVDGKARYFELTLGTAHWEQHTGNSTLGTAHWEQWHWEQWHWEQHTGNSTLGTAHWEQWHWEQHTGNSTLGTAHWEQWHCSFQINEASLAMLVRTCHVWQYWQTLHLLHKFSPD